MSADSYWPADTSVPVLEMTVGDLLREAAAEAPDAVALVEGVPDARARRRWTYRQLLDDAERVARALLSRYRPGERVAVWAHNLPEWELLELGAGLAGVVLVTVNPAFRAQELEYVLGQSRTSGIVLEREYRGNPMAATLDEVRPRLRELRDVMWTDEWDDFIVGGDGATPLPEVRPGDAAQIQYTSGTTGFPKGALLHHRGIVNNPNYYTARAGLQQGEALVHAMPLFHTGGCVQAVLGAIWRRAVHVLLPWFDPGLMLELLEHERGAVAAGVPTMLIALTEHPTFRQRDLSSLHTVVSGGSMVPEQLVRRIEDDLGVKLVIVYGQTELSPVVTQTSRYDTFEQRSTTVGRPLPQAEVKIIDAEKGETVPRGAIGELCARGYQVMTGYFEMPGETAETIDPDRWLHTGDLCSMDTEGYVKVEGRLRDMIIRGGENIYPKEIEEVLYHHPGVGDVAVVGLPDETWGEQVAAFIRPAAGQPRPSEAELFDHVRRDLAPHKTPRIWVFVDELPLTPSGKIQKFKVVEQHMAAGIRPPAATG